MPPKKNAKKDEQPPEVIKNKPQIDENSRKITFPKEHGYAFVISLKTSYHNSN